MKDGPVRIGIIGSQFQADCHAAAISMIEDDMSVVAVASPTAAHAQGLADRYKIPHVYTDYKELASDPDVEAVTITAPNALHCEMTIAMARAGKHVICEKPLCVTPAEADAMIEACRANGVLLLYAEELFFTPKYRKAKEMADSGAFGKVHLIKQSEKHFGPHAEWFWDVKRAGGGALLDLGSHGIAFAWWFLGRPKLVSAYAHLGTYVHGDKTKLDDEAVTIIEFEGNAFSIIENSWARRGGMDDRIEIYGEGGLTIANLHMGNALQTYSEHGFALRRRKGAHDHRLDLSRLRRAVELRLPAGDAPLRPRHPRIGGPAGDWGRRQGCAGGDLCRLRFCRPGAKGHLALSNDGGAPGR